MECLYISIILWLYKTKVPKIKKNKINKELASFWWVLEFSDVIKLRHISTVGGTGSDSVEHTILFTLVT